MLTPLTGRSVVVTGASKGIGRAVAQACGRQGAKVLVVARSADAAAEACDGIIAEGGTARPLAADMRDPAAVQAMADYAAREFGGIDAVVANAGIYPTAFLDDMTVEQWDDMSAVNLRGMFLTVKSCLPHLRASDQGRIVLMSSITGPITGNPGDSHYAATKAGMLGFMRSAALELAGDGVTVNAILPGNIATEGLEDLGDDYLARMAASVPLGALGEPEDIAHAVLFLLSREARYITGQTLVVDGGQTLPEARA
ncbi:3-oxoacyl-ACP reductase FabG [Caenispirillum bisanense]|uniref:3-oxoacyl-[acyl-carrier protein] reductase n=1 Tax=Caenispirillum bisanense TaxID=414052 RepID=A0A286G6J7_9PROT|nr:3-oxoacyl-ACP reductase FabG [Caenispirillum bisanense]SOD91171.1 3-oxoacyl-[acyl-carrier protein] reductase [Caenispirillum bisanense]